MPIEETNNEVQRKLKSKIIDGVYNVGELIVPQTFWKVSIKDGKLNKEEITVQGRKIPLKVIRESLLMEQITYMRLTSDNELCKLTTEEKKNFLKKIGEDNNTTCQEELLQKMKKMQRTRHLMMWHDGSSLASHSHVLMMISTIYDPAVFLTDKEYKEKFGQSINVQSQIEKPKIYILARCKSDNHQLLYGEERMDDIRELKEGIVAENGTVIHDIIRVFKGDKPASQLEAGQQKGGDYFCWLCGINAALVPNMYHAFGRPVISISDRIANILATDQSRKKVMERVPKLYKNLKKQEIVAELEGRKVNISNHTTAKDLQQILDEEMCGIQHIPTLLFHQNDYNLVQNNLNMYEILYHEPLHDISNHTKNLYKELPQHAQKELKLLIEDAIETSFNQKECKNSTDHRKSLLILCNWFMENNINHFIKQLFITMAEIQEISYKSDNERTPQYILRLFTITFIHAMLLKINIQSHPKCLTKRKLFGSYYHSIVQHAPEQYRLFSARSANTEKEEATFNDFKTSTNLTSNHHPSNVILNAIVRAQVSQTLKVNERETTKKESYVHKLYYPIKMSFSNTVISFIWIEKYYKQYQRFLERVADFLLMEYSWWKEVEDGVEFYDHNAEEVCDKKLHHFRSTSLVEEVAFVRKCWEECLENKNLIPAFKIQVVDPITKINTDITLTTLLHFKNKQPIQDEDQTINLADISEIPGHCNTSQTSSQSPDIALYSTIEAPDKSILAVTPPINDDIDFESSSIKYDNFQNNESLLQNDTSIESISKPTNSPGIKITSTPISSKYPKKEVEILQIVPNLSNVNETQSRTITILAKVLGNDDPLISEIERLRKKLKTSTKNKESIDMYRICVAKLEVKLKCTEDRFKNSLKALESKLLLKNDGISMLPCKENITEYEDIVTNLKYVKALKKQFQI